MSLESLATELDDLILPHLDPKCLYALSLTSKTCHAMVERYLYKDIRFTLGQTYELKRLLLNVVQRPELAAYIENIATVPSLPFKPIGARFDFDAQDVPAELFLRKAIDITWPRLRRSEKQYWLGAILSEDCDCFDGCLALLMSMSHNLQHLNLRQSSNCPHTTTFLARSPLSGDPHSHLSNLHVLKLHGPNTVDPFSLILYPSVYEIRVQNVLLDSIRLMPGYNAESTSLRLRSLTLSCVDTDLRVLEAAFHSGMMRNLQRLKLWEVKLQNEQTPRRKLVDLLRQSIPHLQFLQICFQRYPNYYTAGSRVCDWKGFSDLTHLVITMDYLEPAISTLRLVDMLPNGLETLEFVKVERGLRWLVLESNQLRDVMRAMQVHPGKFSLRRIRIHVNEVEEPYTESLARKDGDKELLVELSEGFAQAGVELSIWWSR